MLRRRIFIDGGANRGLLLAAAIELLDDFEFHAFEPNPAMIGSLHELAATHTDRHIRVHHAALWTEPGTLDLFETDPAQDAGREGCTVMAGKTSWGVDYSKPVAVPAIDFDAWLWNTINPDDLVVLKLDIEGAEYPVLERMIETGSLDLVDEVLIEFHNHHFDSIKMDRHARIRSAVLDRPGDSRAWGEQKHIWWRRAGVAPTGAEALRSVSVEQLADMLARRRLAG